MGLAELQPVSEGPLQSVSTCRNSAKIQEGLCLTGGEAYFFAEFLEANHSLLANLCSLFGQESLIQFLHWLEHGGPHTSCGSPALR